MLRIATRGSALARWQAQRVADLLRGAEPGLAVELVAVDTAGDRRQDVPISELGGQGMFVKEVQAAVLDGRADLAVHSAKDLPSAPTEGLWLAAFPERDDPRDALAGSRLADLAPGATVATGSVRRRAQLAALRPDLRFVLLRGNIPTRLQRIPAGGAIVVAAAALRRLSGQARVADVDILEPSVMLPQVGQGALAVECRADDRPTAALLAAIDAPEVRSALEAERAFLARLGGGCDLPVAAHATFGAGGRLTLEGLIAGADGSPVLRTGRTGDPAAGAGLGRAVADDLLGRVGAEGLAAALGR